MGALIPISGTDGRTGGEWGHFAFLPHPLPEAVDLSDSTHVLVAEASAALGALDMASSQIPNPGLLRRPTIRREAHSTSALEGTFAPFEAVMGVESQEDETDLAMREVFNYVRAAEMAFGVLPDRGLTQGLVKELQAMLVDRTASETSDSGGVRNRQVVIGPPGSAVQDARFVPPPPGPQLVAALDEWEAWVRRPHPKLTVVTQAAMAHYQFETIHPFSDGNGRIGRLVIVLHLIQAGVLTDGLLSVSPWFEQRRHDYKDHLLSVSMTGDWDPWVAFFAMALRDQARATIDQVRSLLELQGRFRDLAKERVWTGLAATVLEELIGFPVFSVKSLAKRHGVAFPTANRVVGQLKEARVLTEITGRTYRRTFMAPEVYRIIAR